MGLQFGGYSLSLTPPLPGWTGETGPDPPTYPPHGELLHRGGGGGKPLTKVQQKMTSQPTQTMCRIGGTEQGPGWAGTAPRRGRGTPPAGARPGRRRSGRRPSPGGPGGPWAAEATGMGHRLGVGGDLGGGAEPPLGG